ncbi:MAG: hypothetical protein ACOC24_07055 [Desulfovibrionales bacterium]
MQRITVYLLGVITAVGIMLLMGAAPQGLVNKYQLAQDKDTAFVLDTTSGVVKMVWQRDAGAQLGVPFEEMENQP